jgi:aryl-alcohol dehydrogenase-like predicted oxidoreductase
MDHVVDRSFASWQGTRTRDPRRLALGSAQWGMPYGIANRTGPPSGDELSALVTLARDAGVRTIDTARAYGESERRVGQLLSEQPDWRIVTKLAPDVDAPEAELARNLERVQASLEQSRAALGLATLPALLLHRYAHRHAFGGKLWRALLAEREAGQIGQLGVSAASPEEAWAALDDPDVEVLQVATSLLDLRLYRQGFFPRAREAGRTVYVRSVYLQGAAHLGSARLPVQLAELAPALETIEAFAAHHGVAPRALYLAFVRELPGVHPVLGCETAHQLEQLLRDWEDETVDGALLAALVEALPTATAAAVDPSQWPRAEHADRNEIERGAHAMTRPEPARSSAARTARGTAC